MSETTITCPKCKTEFPLTESLAAPMLAATRKQFEQQLAQKDEDVAKREQSLRDQAKQLTDAKRTLDEQISDQVAAQLKAERARVVAEEGKKAKLASAAELEAKVRELDVHGGSVDPRVRVMPGAACRVVTGQIDSRFRYQGCQPGHKPAFLIRCVAMQAVDDPSTWPVTSGRLANSKRNGYGTLSIHWRTGCAGNTSSTSNAALPAMLPKRRSSGTSRAVCS